MGKPMNDLDVIPSSDALAGRRVDVVVSGSIAAVESVKFIRALRRLGAEVTPWLSHGGATFITPMAVTWAAGKDAVTGFSGNASHIATSDAVIVAPASSSILTKMARGMTDSHCTALLASALGQTKPVLILPSMHDSLWLRLLSKNTSQKYLRGTMFSYLMLDLKRANRNFQTQPTSPTKWHTSSIDPRAPKPRS